MSIAGLLIRRERLARAWSQEGLCSGICGTSYLSKIEQGKAAASEEVLALLFARLGLSWTDDADGALHAQTEACMEALFGGGRAGVCRRVCALARAGADAALQPLRGRLSAAARICL